MEENRFAERLAVANHRIDRLRVAVQSIIDLAESSSSQAIIEIAKDALRMDAVQEEIYQDIKARQRLQNPSIKPSIKV